MKAQDFLLALQAEKGELWGIIVHEVCVIKAMLLDMSHKGVSMEARERMVAFGAMHTSALVKYGGYLGREKEIMEDVDKLLDISMLEAAELHGLVPPSGDAPYFASAGTETVH